MITSNTLFWIIMFSFIEHTQILISGFYERDMIVPKYSFWFHLLWLIKRNLMSTILRLFWRTRLNLILFLEKYSKHKRTFLCRYWRRKNILPSEIYFRNLIKSNRNQIVFTKHQCIWNIKRTVSVFCSKSKTKRTSIWFQINRCMVNKIWFRVDLIRFLCVYLQRTTFNLIYLIYIYILFNLIYLIARGFFTRLYTYKL